MRYETVLKNMVRIGTVDSVDKEKRTARVRFEDKDNLISGELIVLKNQPTVIIEETALTYNLETKTHTHQKEISPWLPDIGQIVLCLYLAMDNADGFVIGGI